MENFVGQRLFIPISIGNHYYSSAVLTRILSEITVYSAESIFFICDRLRYLIYKARGYEDEAKIQQKLEREVVQLKRSLINCGLSKYKNARIETWKFLKDQPGYINILSEVTSICESDRDVSIFLEGLVFQLANRFFSEINNKVLAIQRSYVLEETALSLFMTELYGFNVEVYQRFNGGLIDLIYKSKANCIRDFLGKSYLQRTFVSLENFFR